MNLGFEIAGVFLFIGGFAYLIFSGRLVNMFRDRAPKPILLIAVVTGIAFHHWGALLSEPATATGPAAPEPLPAVPISTPAPRVSIKRPSRAPTAPPAVAAPAGTPESEHWQTIIVKEGTPEQVFVPQATDPPRTPPPDRSGPDPYESKAKRGMKAVGKFLHLRKTAQ